MARGILPERGPRRTLAAASFVNMLGGVVFTLGSGLYFTRVVGLSVAQVGLGTGAGALVGLLSGIPVGHLADRRGPREVYRATLGVQAAAMAALLLVRSFWLFVIVISLTQLASSASQAARGPLLRGLAGKRPAEYRAYLRAVVNLAAALAAAPVALVVQLDSRGGYLCLVLGNAASFLATAALVGRLPSLPPVPPPPGSGGRWTALRDLPFLAVTVLDGVLSMQGTVQVFVLPLWIVGHTEAPRWFVGAGVLVNTVLVVLLQVRVGRRVTSPAAAARSWRRAGWAFLASMAVIGSTAGLGTLAAVLLIPVGIVLHTVGELWQAAGSFELRFRLAPAHAQGQYAGVLRIGSGLASAVAPALLGGLCLSGGAAGWTAAGCLFALVGLTAPAGLGWGGGTPPPPPPPTPGPPPRPRRRGPPP
ncbi:MFS transporter, partial [Kitasatospora sp. NPDC059571]|uniref:MFS transporter n=1 Tax=Kitasatospora sp. NPDC059571 TaxID=3346871 RepID=UPI00367F910B